MFYILDTDHVSLLLLGNRSIAERLTQLSFDQIATTIITAEEQLRGRLNVIRQVSPTQPAQLIQAYQRLHSTLNDLQ